MELHSYDTWRPRVPYASDAESQLLKGDHTRAISQPTPSSNAGKAPARGVIPSTTPRHLVLMTIMRYISMVIITK